MLILHFFFIFLQIDAIFPFSYMIFLINSPYNADETEKAPQEYYLWGLNQLKKINTMKSFPKIG